MVPRRAGGSFGVPEASRTVRETAVTRSKNLDPVFVESLLGKGLETMLSGDVEAGKAILRDYIKATVGFEKLGEATATPPKSLIRMFGPSGNPQARNLFGVIGYLQKQAGLELQVTPQRQLSSPDSARTSSASPAV
jgi:hypothetical protein